MILRRRLGQLATGDKAWLNHVGETGRIHGTVLHIGTPHSRASHFNPNLAQVPNQKKGKPFAAECRALFRAPDGWVVVPCDLAGIQDRAFARHLAPFDGGRYAQVFRDGADTHWQTAIVLGLIPQGTIRDKQSRIHTIIREGAKIFRYAFLFGCGAARAGQIIADTMRAVRQIDPTYTPHSTDGRQILDRFIAATPGLQQLRANLEAQVRRHGWLPGLDGRRIPARALKDALNYLVVGSEAVITKRWLIDVHDEICARFRYGWDGDVVVVAWIHDELGAVVGQRSPSRSAKSWCGTPKKLVSSFGFLVPIAADYKIGRSWAGEPLDTPPSGGSEADAGELPHDDDPLVELLDSLDGADNRQAHSTGAAPADQEPGAELDADFDDRTDDLWPKQASTDLGAAATRAEEPAEHGDADDHPADGAGGGVDDHRADGVVGLLQAGSLLVGGAAIGATDSLLAAAEAPGVAFLTPADQEPGAFENGAGGHAAGAGEGRMVTQTDMPKANGGGSPAGECAESNAGAAGAGNGHNHYTGGERCNGSDGNYGGCQSEEHAGKPYGPALHPTHGARLSSGADLPVPGAR